MLYYLRDTSSSLEFYRTSWLCTWQHSLWFIVCDAPVVLQQCWNQDSVEGLSECSAAELSKFILKAFTLNAYTEPEAYLGFPAS